jgi:hypothetical protein
VSKDNKCQTFIGRLRWTIDGHVEISQIILVRYGTDTRDTTDVIGISPNYERPAGGAGLTVLPSSAPSP